MNTIPDEALLALWLDDELEGEELARVESWAAGQPEQLAAREEIRAWRKTIASAVPATEEPPYPDFFNSRIMRTIRELPAEQQEAAPVRVKVSFWSWLFPATAVAGMALAFWVGTKAHTESPSRSVVTNKSAKEVIPAWYTPEQGVNAEWAKGEGSSNVIVLRGLSAIPDTQDFSASISLQSGGSESGSTAGNAATKPAP